MTQKLRLPVPNTVDLDRARALLKAIRQRVSERKVTSYSDLMKEAMSALEQFYLNLSRPTAGKHELLDETPRDPETFNVFMRQVEEDLIGGFNGARDLSAGVVQGFNYTAALVGQLLGKINKLTSRSQDLQHASGIFTDDVISVGDDFVDVSKVDLDFPVNGERAEVMPGAGSVLRRLEATPATAAAEITVEANLPIYEGKFYAMDGEAEPEGGQFHFRRGRTSSRPAVTVPPGPPTTVEEAMTGGPFGGLGALERAETDAGGSEEERQDIRQNMLDGNPDTYWQAEYVVNTPVTETEEISYQELVDRLAGPGIDRVDLSVTITYKLPEPRILNFLVLDPLQAGDGAWLEVTDISTSVDGREFAQIEGLHDHTYENTLTDEANEEITEHEVSMTLAPNKYQYAGQGVWVFPAIEARYIRVSLLQRAPVPAPYDVELIETARVVTVTHRGHRGTESSVIERKRVISRNYIETLRSRYGSGTLSSLSQPRRAESGAGKSYTAGDAFRDFIVPFGFLSGGSQDRSTTHDYGAETIADSWLETRWDKARYAVGIRDFRGFSYRYSESSANVSVAFRTPKPIRKVTLLADEVVPKDFDINRQVRPWIRYWITLDAGATWYALAPLTPSAPGRLDGQIIPAALDVNSGVPEEEQDPQHTYIDAPGARDIRIKWEISRPGGTAEQTPVLRGYRLQIAIEGGL